MGAVPASRGDRQVTGQAIRRIVLDQSRRANVGHIGSSLSIADILAALYDGAIRGCGPADPARDRFVLGKGHAALSLYAALALKGWMPASDLDTYCGDDTLLGVHPEHALAGVDFCSGSLGHALPIAAGSALASQMRGQRRHSFALISDGELNEGSVWEAFMFAGARQLAGLTVILDENGQQAFGYTRDIVPLPHLVEQVRGFGWTVHDIDGHDEAGLAGQLTACRDDPDGPHLVVARTTFGKGVSYMEGAIKWHYWPMSDEEYATALHDIGETPAGGNA